MNSSFTHLQSYSQFLLEHHLDDLVKEAISQAKQAELPVLKLLADYTDEVIFAISKKGFEEDILKPIIQNTPFVKIKENIKAWKSNAILVPKDKLKITDITSIHNIRKNVLIDFIKYYDCSKDQILALIKEIERFFYICTDLGLIAYEEISNEELSEKNEVIQGVLSNIPIVITRLNREGKIIYSVGAGLKSLGIKDNELVNKSIYKDYLYPENIYHTEKALKGEPVSYIGRARSVSGEVREFHTFYLPEKEGVLGFSLDVSEKRSIEKGFFNFVEGVKDYAIFMLSTEGIISSWNEGAKALKGYTKEEIIGQHFSVFYKKEQKDEKFPQYELEQATLHGRFETEGLRLRKDGSSFWANVVITAVFNEENKLIGFTKITRDLTERKLAEEKLKLSEERYRLLVDAAKDYAIFLLDREGKIISWNEGARRLKGYSENEIIGKHFSIFYTQEKKDEKFPEFELVQAQKYGRFEDEGIRIKKDGSTFYANVVITALYNSKNEHIGFSKITRDLSERKFYEEDLKAMNHSLEMKVAERTEELLKSIKELKKINNDLDNFIYTASHDLKAPISNIEGLISSLYEELEDFLDKNGNLKEIKEMIDVSVQKFQVTIKDLTEIAKIQKENIENLEVVDLSELIDDVKFTIADQIQKNDAEIIYDFDGCSQIKFVKKNLKSIVYNLISNGIKYRSPERKPVVKIMCSTCGNYNTIVCEDNGLGIREENHDKIFGMFKRFHDHVEGTGVGLYIVKRIIENAGGKIEVESIEGEGSKFKVFLPK